MRIVIAEIQDYPDAALHILRGLGEVVEGVANREVLVAESREANVLIVRLRYRLDAELLSAAPRLHTIVSATTGLDHIDEAFAKSRNIAILSLKGEESFRSTIPATAELTWGLLIALVRRIPGASQDVLLGNWRRDLFRGIDLRGRTLGILGFGRLGRMVASYGVAFGMRVLATDIRPALSSSSVEFVSFEDLLGRSDVLSLHLPFNERTRHMIGSTAFATLKPGAILINTSRGAIIDGAALLAALQDGRLSGAAVDVVEGETPGEGTMIGHALVHYARDHQNLLITPHVGGASRESMEATECFMASKLARHLSTVR